MILRTLARSPIIADALIAERAAVTAARGALLARIATIRETTAQVAKDLGQDAAAARVEALAQHKLWTAAEQKHAALAVTLFRTTQSAESDVQRLETQLATDPALSREFAMLRDQIEDAHERVRHTRPDFGGSATIPSREYAPAPIEGSGREASRRHRQQKAAPEEVRWWQSQEERLAAIRAMRGRAAAATLLADPAQEIAAIRAELAQLVRMEG